MAMNPEPSPQPPPLPPTGGRRPPGILASALIGACIVGGISFAAGFFGPIILRPDSPQGPMLGIFFTGPLGFVVGLIGGAVVGFVRTRGK